MELHHGQIVEKRVRRSGYSIAEVARLAGVNRRSVYNWFNQQRLNHNTILLLGNVLKHDFSVDFPEIILPEQNSPFINTSILGTYSGRIRPPTEDEYWKNKYIDLLEAYQEFLQDKVNSDLAVQNTDNH